ncbi:sporulation protein YabP [Caproicibacter fermentans]|nr:sporulation protein YabP [Caproicibacter fermentans]
MKQYEAGGITLAEQKTVKTPHSLILENRRTLTATGVSNVDSFDEQTVVAYTDLGELVIHGVNLHIDKLNIDSGELTLDGEITSMSYTDNRATTGGFFTRLFK